MIGYSSFFLKIFSLYKLIDYTFRTSMFFLQINWCITWSRIYFVMAYSIKASFWSIALRKSQKVVSINYSFIDNVLYRCFLSIWNWLWIHNKQFYFALIKAWHTLKDDLFPTIFHTDAFCIKSRLHVKLSLVKQSL